MSESIFIKENAFRGITVFLSLKNNAEIVNLFNC